MVKMTREEIQVKLFGTLVIVVVMLIVALVLSVCGCPDAEGAEPWYYQSDEDIEFQIPDKVQHYLGSYFLSEVTGPGYAIAAGVLWEVKQKLQGGEFGERDLFLDLLGSFQVGYINFEKREERWTVNLSFDI